MSSTLKDCPTSGVQTTKYLFPPPSLYTPPLYLSPLGGSDTHHALRESQVKRVECERERSRSRTSRREETDFMYTTDHYLEEEKLRMDTVVRQLQEEYLTECTAVEMEVQRIHRERKQILQIQESKNTWIKERLQLSKSLVEKYVDDDLYKELFELGVLQDHISDLNSEITWRSKALLSREARVRRRLEALRLITISPPGEECPQIRPLLLLRGPSNFHLIQLRLLRRTKQIHL